MCCGLFRKRHQLLPTRDVRAVLVQSDTLVIAPLRNENWWLPFWLEHHRAAGVGHFTIVEWKE